MAAAGGHSLTLAVESSPASGTYNTLAMLDATTVTQNNQSVDITTKGDHSWRTLLSGAGIQSVSISGGGVSDASSNVQIMVAAKQADSILNYRITTNEETITGAFQITAFDLAGDEGDAQRFTFTLESSGEPTFT